MGRLVNKIPEMLIHKEMRDKKRYSQRDLADGSGVEESTISRIMNYETLDKVSFGSIVKIAHWLEVSPLDLVEESDVDAGE